MNKSSIIVICHLLMSPDRTIQAVNTILRRDIILSGWHSQINPFILRLLCWRPTFTITFYYKPVTTINFSGKLTK
jgi:hypothetical protein